MAASCRRLDVYLVFGAFCFGAPVSEQASSVAVDEPIIPLCTNETPSFKIDTALLTIRNDLHTGEFLLLFMQSEECHTCDLLPELTIEPATNCSILVDTRWPVRLQIQSAVNSTNIKPPHQTCSERNLSQHFLQYGDYDLYIQTNTPGKNVKCSSIILMNDPMDVNIPIYVGLGIAVFLVIFTVLMTNLYRRGILHRILYFWSTDGMMVDLGSPTNINAGEDPNKDDKQEKKERLRSLDTFRGLSLVVMNFVNYGGGNYWFFNHSDWNGLTIADLVFPWFVWIMGTSMVFSFSGQLKRNTSRSLMFWKVLKRAAILFLLGLLINTDGVEGGVHLQDLRIPGVLQRFTGTYLIVATIHMFFAKKSDETRFMDKWWAPIRDITFYWPEWIIHLTLVGVWLALTFALPVPGCPTGYLGPGGLHDHGKYANCTGGAAGYIDRVIFGDSHIYQNPTAKPIYRTTVAYDPEGLLGTLTSCFMCFLGLQAGKILFIQKDYVQRCKRFLIWGILLGVIAAVLCKFSKDDGWIPINKNLWSISFVLCMASFAFFLFCACYLLIDVWKIWSGAPFYYPGMNSIFYYVCHEVFNYCFPVRVATADWHSMRLLIDVWGPAFWCIVTYKMYLMKLYITV